MTERVADWSFFTMFDYIAQADREERAPDPAVWAHLTRRITEAVAAVNESPAVTTDLERTSAYRGLLQLFHFGLERILGTADPARPVMSRPWWVFVSDFGAANPDGIYHTAALRDDVTYRISGTCGNAEFFSIELFAGTKQAGSIAKDDLQADADGRFEICFGPTERPGNWLEVVPGTSSLLTREFFTDWTVAEPGDYRIEALVPAPLAWPPLSAERVEREIRALGDWLVSTVEIFSGAHVTGIDAHRNAFRAEDPRPNSGLPSIYHGFWDLADDECLVVEAAPPPGSYWGIQMANGLWNTHDFVNRQSSLNLGQVARETDGSIRLVVSHRDPGVDNWLDTIGHRTGQLTLRFTYDGNTKPPRAGRTLAATQDDWMSHWDAQNRHAPVEGAYPAPTTRIVKLVDVAAEWPADRLVDDDARRAEVDRRMEQMTRMLAGRVPPVSPQERTAT